MTESPSSASRSVTVAVDFGEPIGTFTPLHGINNGPICFGGVVDLSEWHRALDLPSTRLHDPGWPHPVVVDIPTIFPDFGADPEDAASYRFDRTDDYLATLVPLTRKVIYRLGTSIEHTVRKYDTAPPADYERWAKICLGVIKHLNQGWAGGHRFGIRDFEIWNEPDIGERMWQGSQQDYLELYGVAARAIKEHDPALRVGGPVVAHTDGPLGPAFVDYVTTHRLPVDFFAWHRYAADPADLADHARAVRALLDGHGLERVDSYLTEWNWVTEWHWTGEPARAMHLRNKSARGAAFVASCLIALQEAGVDEANFYSGDTQWFGLFDEFGLPQKNYFGLLAASRLFGRQQRVQTTVTQPPDLAVSAAAGRGDDGVVVVISSFEGVEAPLTVELSRHPGEGPVTYRVSRVDSTHDLACVRAITTADRNLVLSDALPAGSVIMISTVPENS